MQDKWRMENLENCFCFVSKIGVCVPGEKGEIGPSDFITVFQGESVSCKRGSDFQSQNNRVLEYQVGKGSPHPTLHGKSTVQTRWFNTLSHSILKMSIVEESNRISQNSLWEDKSNGCFFPNHFPNQFPKNFPFMTSWDPCRTNLCVLPLIFST